MDVAALGADYLACSAYKFYGPHLGILWGRHALLEALDTPRLEPAPSHAPEKLETGTQNHEGIVGAGAAVNFLAGSRRASWPGNVGLPGRTNVDLRPDERQAPWPDHLRALAGGNASRTGWSFSTVAARRSWPVSGRVSRPCLASASSVRRPAAPALPPWLSLSRGCESEEVARHLASRAVFVSHGDFYATTAVRRLGVGPTGVVRAGCACYTTEEEIDRLVAAVAEVRLPEGDRELPLADAPREANFARRSRQWRFERWRHQGGPWRDLTLARVRRRSS